MTNVLEYLENTAAHFGDEIKVKEPGRACSYKALMEGSKAAASALLKYNLCGKPAAVYMEKSINALMAFFGTVYAGGFYTMINTRNPKDRIEMVLSVLDSQVIITDKEHEEFVKELSSGADVLLIEDMVETKVDEASLAKIREMASADDPLYALFTSGSTGVPKGVLISHRCVIDFMDYFPEMFDITKDDIIGNQAPFDFDVSVKDIYSALKTGATLVIIPTAYFALPTTVLDYICDEHCTVLTWAVSALCLISVLKGFTYKIPTDVKKVNFSGEAMPLKQLEIWQNNLPEAKFVNLYGPTEITCNCSYYRIDKHAKEMETLPMGSIFPTRKVFLLDDENKEVKEANVRAEICVAGTSLALGYYKNKEATDKAFTDNPLNPGERIYRTGDLAYYDEAGNLVFAGRKDFQIKHMGHRIELEEIEKAISGFGGVDRAICIYDHEKSKIYGFYQGNVDSKELKKELLVKLPEYMVPQKFIQVEEMPLTKNGKTDRKALAELAKSQKRERRKG